MRALLEANRNDLALVIGNGINRFEAPAATNSWEGLLQTLARAHIDPAHGPVPHGVSPTEFYDIVDLAIGRGAGAPKLQAEFCKLMAGWKPLPQHAWTMAWAQRWAVPVLTTNFEATLAQACAATLRRCGTERGTAFYPWFKCFSTQDVADPLDAFAIWHVNGFQQYRQSIRLGLADYMGSVDKARGWIYSSGTRLFGAADPRKWAGALSWLQVFLHKPLLFAGLGLEQDEVFLRWLLIERARYFNRFAERRRAGWYVHAGAIDPGKAFFLRGVGIEPLAVAGYAQIWDEPTWA